MRVWITRTRPGAEATAARLAALGHEPLVAPLLEARALAGAAIELEGAAALAFTSANGVAAFAARSPMRTLPVFTVGEATAAAARQAGFASVRSADGDVADLAQLIVGARLSGTVLHLAPRERAGDLEGALVASGRACRTVELYETVAADRLPPAVARALEADAVDAVLIHSPKAGAALARLVDPAEEAFAVFALSAACAEPLERAGFRALAVADEPNDRALLALLS